MAPAQCELEYGKLAKFISLAVWNEMAGLKICSFFERSWKKKLSNLLNICICNVSFCTFHSETFPPRRRELNSIKILTSKIEIQFHIVPNLILPNPKPNI